jgi:hypothetical protein
MFLKNGAQIGNERRASKVFMGVGGKKEWISNKLYNPFITSEIFCSLLDKIR